MSATLTREEALAKASRFAQLTSDIDLIEAMRADAIAQANAKADATATPLLAEQVKIKAELETWWAEHGADLAGKRKTVEFGGCMIGTTAGRTTLSLPADLDACTHALTGFAWAEPFVRTSTAIDKAAVLKGLDGEHGAQLKALGFAASSAPSTFTIKRAAQSGVVTH